MARVVVWVGGSGAGGWGGGGSIIILSQRRTAKCFGVLVQIKMPASCCFRRTVLSATLILYLLYCKNNPTLIPSSVSPTNVGAVLTRINPCAAAKKWPHSTNDTRGVCDFRFFLGWKNIRIVIKPSHVTTIQRPTNVIPGIIQGQPTHEQNRVGTKKKKNGKKKA